MSNLDINLFRDEEFEEVRLTPDKVLCLGMEFDSDEARRAYFREELRKKLVEMDMVECVIALGHYLFYNSAMISAVMILKSFWKILRHQP